MSFTRPHWHRPADWLVSSWQPLVAREIYHFPGEWLLIVVWWNWLQRGSNSCTWQQFTVAHSGYMEDNGLSANTWGIKTEKKKKNLRLKVVPCHCNTFQKVKLLLSPTFSVSWFAEHFFKFHYHPVSVCGQVGLFHSIMSKCSNFIVTKTSTRTFLVLCNWFHPATASKLQYQLVITHFSLATGGCCGGRCTPVWLWCHWRNTDYSWSRTQFTI